MTLEKAIVILTIHVNYKGDFSDPDLKDALRLGIEALRFCAEYERVRLQPSTTVLEGETEEPPNEKSPHQEAITRKTKRGTE